MFSLGTAPTNSLILTNVGVSLYADLQDVSSVHNMTLAVILLMKHNTLVFYIFASLNSWNLFSLIMARSILWCCLISEYSSPHNSVHIIYNIKLRNN